MKILIGDILQSKAQTLINTINCVGVMGKGIALEFKQRFPDMYDDYLKRCAQKEVALGVPYLYRTLFPPQIVNFPTKDHWRSVSRLRDIEKGLQHLVDHVHAWGITSIAIPPLGCGNGQLEWRAVGPLLYRYAKQTGIPVELYAPYGTPPKELTVEFLAHAPSVGDERRRIAAPSGIKPAWLALVEILRRLEEQPYHWPVGRIIFQKIAYVATRQGLPTGFVYRQGSFGPFSAELKHAMAQLINGNLLQEQRVGGMFVVKVGSRFERMRPEVEPALAQWTGVIERTTDLFLRVNTDQAELMATVMYAADALKQDRDALLSESEILRSVMQWKQKRRPPLNASVAASTIRNLGVLRWLDVTLDPSLPVAEEEFSPA